MSSVVYDPYHRQMYSMCEVQSSHRGLENVDIVAKCKSSKMKKMEHQSWRYYLPQLLQKHVNGRDMFIYLSYLRLPCIVKQLLPELRNNNRDLYELPTKVWIPDLRRLKLLLHSILHLTAGA